MLGTINYWQNRRQTQQSKENFIIDDLVKFRNHQRTKF